MSRKFSGTISWTDSDSEILLHEGRQLEDPQRIDDASCHEIFVMSQGLAVGAREFGGNEALKLLGDAQVPSLRHPEHSRGSAPQARIRGIAPRGA